MTPNKYYEVFVRWPDGDGQMYKFKNEQEAFDKFLFLQNQGYAGGKSRIVVRVVTVQDITQDIEEVANNDRR